MYLIQSPSHLIKALSSKILIVLVLIFIHINMGKNNPHPLFPAETVKVGNVLLSVVTGHYPFHALILIKTIGALIKIKDTGSPIHKPCPDAGDAACTYFNTGLISSE